MDPEATSQEDQQVPQDQQDKQQMDQDTFCRAILKDDSHRKCSRKARDGFDTCTQHQNFFQGPSWCSRFLWNDQDHILQIGEPTEDSPQQRIRDHVVETIRSGRVTVGKSEIKRIPATENYVVLFIMLMNQGIAKPLWNKKLALIAFKYFIRLRRFGVTDLPLHRYIPAFFDKANFYLDYILPSLVAGVQAFLSREPPQIHWDPRPLFLQMIQEAIDQTDFRYISFADTGYIRNKMLTLSKLTDAPADAPGVVFLDHDVMPLIKGPYVACKLFLKSLVDPMDTEQRTLKEELMMNRWHPKRVQLLFETYGEDFEEYC